jgi:hypothetical protein
MEGRGDLVSLLGAETAVPACAGIGFFGAKGKRKACQPSRASSAAGDDQLVWLLPIVWVEEIGVHSAARGSSKLAPEMPVVSVVDEVSKFALAASEEVRGVTHGSVVSSSRPVFRPPNRVRVSWETLRTRCGLPPGPEPGVVLSGSGRAGRPQGVPGAGRLR